MWPLTVLGVVSIVLLSDQVQSLYFEVPSQHSDFSVGLENVGSDLHLTARKGGLIKHRSVIEDWSVGSSKSSGNKYEFKTIDQQKTISIEVKSDKEKYFAVVGVIRGITFIRDCKDLDPENLHWYGGPQQKFQYWPVEKLRFNNYSYVTKEADNCAIAERYWLNSDGIYYTVGDNTPLFLDQTEDQLCFVGQLELPYNVRAESFTYEFSIGIAEDARSAHLYAVEDFLGRPHGSPDARMAMGPIWSTWARYKRDINETVVLEFANEILDNEFTNSQYEIDDDWEVCYGALTFNTKKFPDIRGLVDNLKRMGFRVTLWIHPFINKGCEPWYSEAQENGYLVRDFNNSTDTEWWNSGKGEAAYVDFTNPKAHRWFADRLKRLQMETGLDSYKFDAGESSWSPPDPNLHGSNEHHPLLITRTYIDTVAQFGPMVEVRSGFRNQEHAIYTRMIDKDSEWSWNNGLPTLVTTLLQLNMNGYPLVLPDMIGGNGYNDHPPNDEMFLRWLQANVFMPSLQFSYVPWDFKNKTFTELCNNFTKLHEAVGDLILERFHLAVYRGDPVNPPIWWVDPKDKVAQQVYDEFLLGEDILSAPILEKNTYERDIYIPQGLWVDINKRELIEGPIWLRKYPAPLEVLPFFVRLPTFNRFQHKLSFFN